jgi:hypothetical protein
MNFPNVERLAAATTKLGLSPLSGVRHAHAKGPVDTWVLTFDGQPRTLLLQQILWDTDRDLLRAEAAARAVLNDAELGLTGGMQILPDGTLPKPSALVPPPAGRPGKALFEQLPLAAKPILQELGHLLARLEEVFVLRHGTRGNMNRFTPLRAMWSEEWRALAESVWLTLQSSCVADTAVAKDVWHALHANLQVIPDEVTPALVHLGLRPSSLRFNTSNAGLQLASVGDLGDCVAGDALAGWAPLLCRLNAPQLALVVEAYGAEQARELLEPATVGRIQAYARTKALWQLRDAAQRCTQQPGPAAAQAVERALAVCHACRSDDWASGQLRAALDKTSQSPQRSTLSDGGRLEHRSLMALACGPVLPSDRAPYILSVLACAQLAEATDEDHATAFLKKGEMFLRTANLPRTIRQAMPIENRATWRQRLAETAVEQCTQCGPATGLALVTAALDVAARLDTNIGAPCLRGLEALAWATWSAEAPLRGSSALNVHERLVHGILGLDAALRLGRPELAEAWKAQLEDAVDVLELGQLPAEIEKATVTSLLPLLTRPLNYTGRRMLMLPMAAAMLRLEREGQLPREPGVLFPMAFGT